MDNIEIERDIVLYYLKTYAASEADAKEYFDSGLITSQEFANYIGDLLEKEWE